MMSSEGLGLLLLLLSILTAWGGFAVALRAKDRREQRGDRGYPLARSPLALSIMGVAVALLVTSLVVRAQ